ncbi:MAG: HAMP domain-containing protein [Candidatus Sericytochromatia bacterium]|nr:HAMP domain-containing protein [Candidatus Sericytochromatia bacterium]
MNKLYRQVYLYSLGVLILSLLLSGLSMSLLFGKREQGMLTQAFRRQVHFIRRDILKTEARTPALVPEQLAEISEQLGWDLAYWHRGQLVYSSIQPAPALDSLGPPQILVPNQALVLSPPYKPQLLLALSSRDRERSQLWMQLSLSPLSRPLRGPFAALLFLLLFLALLLIPLIRFVLRPYRDLQQSLDKLAEGRFDGQLNASTYPAFAELVTAFNRMQERLQAMMQQKQRLVADVSHELRSPLTRLRLKLELLQASPPEGKEMFERAVAEIEELDRIIDDVLEISRLQLHSLPLKRENLNLRLLLFEISEQHAELLDRKDLQLAVQAPDHSVEICADRRLLQRVFNNLFSNLIKYVPGPGTVDLTLKETASGIVLTLRDRGPGIAAAELPHVFTPFFRLDPSRSRRTGGVGLGLAIVWEIIQAHQGQSEPICPQTAKAVWLWSCSWIQPRKRSPHHE